MKLILCLASNNEKVLSSDKIQELNKDLISIAESIDENIDKIDNIKNDIFNYTSKGQDTNNQIDDSYVDLNTLYDKLKDSLTLISSIDSKLKDYSENGTQYLT